MFQSGKHQLLNADVNGASNILRNVIGDSFIKEIINRGVVVTPIKIDV